MFRFLITLAIILGLAVCGATVPLGKRTFFGHVRAIWSSDEAKDMRDGIKDKAGPAVDKVKRGVKAGVDEAKKDGSGATDDKTRH